MPQLARLRFVRVGHREARADDLQLTFTDRGVPTDTTLWLRNGGGKSSLLALFFAMLVPNRNKFLGKADAGVRELGEYVWPGETGVVIAEWLLDGKEPVLDPQFADRPRFLTALALEWGESRGDEAKPLNRAYFCARTVPGVPASAFETLPLGTATQRATLRSLRQAWAELKHEAPDAAAAWTDNAREWGAELEAAGLDPRLFVAQVTMNQGEGEADRLFAELKTSDDYVRYFLSLLAPLDLSEPLLKNLEAHRVALRTRQTQLKPEESMVTGLLERMAPLVALQADRAARAATVSAALGEAEALDQALEARALHADRNAEEAEAEAQRQRQALVAAEQAAGAALQEASWHHRWLAAQAWEAAEHEADQVGREAARAQYEDKLWGATVVYSTVRRHELTAERHEATLATLEQAHRPLRADLEQAALRLAGALEARRLQALAQQDAARTALANAEHAEQAARTAEVDANRESARAGEQAAQATRQREAALAERQRLELQGCLEAGEPVADAQARHQRIRDQAHVALAQNDAERAEAEAQRTEARQAARAAQQRSVQAGNERATCARALQAAEDDADRLSADVVLARLLEIDHTALDVRILDAAAVTQLRRTAALAHEQELARQVDVVSETRALSYLEAHGILPPSPVVERLLGLLRARLPQAWDGWSYLTGSFDPEAARAIITRAPALVTGLVVPDQHFETACAILRGAEASLDEPVLLAPVSALLPEHQDALTTTGLVVGPGDDAHFHREAGARALLVRTERHRETCRAQTEASRLASEAMARALELEHYLQRYPAAWRETMTAARDRATRALELADQEQRAHEATNEQAEARLAALRALRETARDQVAQVKNALALLQVWQDRHPGGVPTYEAALATALAARAHWDAARTEAGKARDEAVRARDRASAAGTTAEVLLAECTSELTRVTFLPAGPVPVVPGDPVLLRQAHADLVRLYEERVGASDLTAQIQAARDEAAAQRDHLTTQYGMIPLAEMEAAFAAVGDPGEAARRQVEADARRAMLFQRHGNTSSTARLRKSQLEAAEQAWRDAGGLDLGSYPDPPSHAVATERERAARQAEARARQAATQAADVLATAEAVLRDERYTSDKAREARDALRQALLSLRVLATGLGQRATPAPVPGPLDEPAVRARRARLGELLLREQEAIRDLDRARDAAHHTVQRWCDEPVFAGLGPTAGQRLKVYTAAQLEGEAKETVDKLELRLRILRDDIAATERDRMALIQQARSTARDGATLLQRLARSSAIPETVPNVGGSALLRCDLRLPEDEAEEVARMGTLLDDFVTRGELPDALRFLQEAVLRLAGPITLQVLRPSMDTMGRYEPITTLAKFSGGEKLTVATLLYCAIATTRAHTVGKRKEPTSTLLMDNPFGKASRASFITLQMAVARRLGIQLIYLTGINDLEALRCFPTVVRLENARYDRRTGERIIQLGDAEETKAILSAVRLTRRNPEAKAEAS